MTYTFNIEPISPANSPVANEFPYSDKMLKATILNALEIWAQAANIVFIEVPKAQKGPNIHFRLAEKGDFESTIIEIYGCRRAVGNGSSTIVINSKQAWANPGLAQAKPVGIDMLTVLIHEVGHALGLDHEDSIEASIMFKNYLGVCHKLASRDEQAIAGQFGPIRANFSIPNPTKKSKTGKSIQFLNIGPDQYLFFAEKPDSGSGTKTLKAFRSRSLRTWERLELPELASENFATHLHLTKLSKRLLITKQGAGNSQTRMSIVPISWYAPNFSKKMFDEITNIGLRDTQTVVFDENLVAVGFGESGLETCTIERKPVSGFSPDCLDKYGFADRLEWIALAHDKEPFKLVSTPDRALLFILEKNGDLNWRFNETGTSWSAPFGDNELTDIAAFDVVSFGGLLYLAHVNHTNPEIATVRELRLDDSQTSKLKVGSCFQTYRFDPNEMAGRDWLSLSIVQQNARITLVAENEERLFFQDI